jgi:hypothetical protein
VTTSLEARIARLEAAEEIRALKARYAAISDSGYNADQIAELFTAEAVWDGGERFGRHEGIEAIRALFEGFGRQIVWALHYMVAPLIEIDDDLEHASGSWYLWQPCSILDEQGPHAIWLTGKYAERYVRERGAWKFAEVRVDCQTISPFEEGWVRTPFWGE